MSSSLAGWTPIELRFDGSVGVVRWCFTDGIEFSDPFFDQTIDRCLRDPFRLLFWRETPIEALAEIAAVGEVEPAGFIFHMSRCGSTLLAQLLAALPATRVISEAGPIDAMLQADHSARAEGEDVALLRALIAALGAGRGEAPRLVVKFDAWAMFQLQQIRRAFPHTPSVFVYRNPVEVLVSHLGQRGYHMIPGTLPPAWLGLSEHEPWSLSPERYIAAVLAGLCRPAVDAARDGQLTLVQYRCLPKAARTVGPLFGIDVGPDERAAFAAVAERNAKNPYIPFVADAAEKQRCSTPEARAAVDASVGPLYEELETLRGGQA